MKDFFFLRNAFCDIERKTISKEKMTNLLSKMLMWKLVPEDLTSIFSQKQIK